MGKLIKKLTILATLLTFALGTIVYADEEEDNYFIPDDEKELVLYNADGDIDGDGEEDMWIGFSYYDEEYDCSVLEITYNGKTLEDLIADGYTVEFKKFDTEPSMCYKNWNDFSELNLYNHYIVIRDIFEYRYTFKITKGNFISMSDLFIPYTENPDDPIIISTKPDIQHERKVFAYNGKSVKVTLKYNNCLELEDENIPGCLDLHIPSNSETKIDNNYQFFTSNFNYENHSEIITINENEYIYNYCIVSFYCNFPHVIFSDSSDDHIYGYYSFLLKNFTDNGGSFHFDIINYKDDSMNPQKEAVIKDHRINLSLAESTTLNVDILSDEVSADDITFVSSDDMIASVDKNGVVTANSVGTAYIYAESKTSDEVYDYCIINVYDSSVQVPVSSIKLDKDIVSLQTGSETKLTATVLPENSIDKSVTWSSSNNNVAYVSSDGTVTAVSEGECTITCTSLYDENITATVAVKVISPSIKISEITVSGQKSVNAGKKFRLKTSISPENATKTDLNYKSSNTKYATVNSKGIVTTKTAGAGKTVTITITANDGSNVSATYTFKINPIKVTRINLTASKKSVKAGAKLKISAIIKPSNATDKSVTFKVSNTKYATINSKGVLTAKKAGKGKKVTVTATAKDGSKVKGSLKIKIK